MNLSPFRLHVSKTHFINPSKSACTLNAAITFIRPERDIHDFA